MCLSAVEVQEVVDGAVGGEGSFKVSDVLVVSYYIIPTKQGFLSPAGRV